MNLENLENLENLSSEALVELGEELIKLNEKVQAQLFHINEILDLRCRAILDENY